MRSQHSPEAGDDSDADDDNTTNTDCFFESLNRVPSGISLHLPSSSSDSDFDDSRVSFASALAPPSVTHHSSSSSDEDDDDHGYDYDIWMSEPLSVHERRRRLLQGFTSQKDFTAPSPSPSPSTLKHSLSRLSLRTTEPSPPHHHALPPLSSVTLTRSRSDSQLVPSPNHPATFRRAMSAPPALHGLQSKRAGGEPPMQSDSPTVCRIKNLDTGKEFVVSELSRVNDIQTGLQLTLEEFERFLGYSPVVKELMRRVKLGGGDEKKREASVKASAPVGSRRRKGGGWLKNIKFVASSVTGLISDRDREGGLGRSSSAGGSGRMKVRHHGKSHKELTGLYMCQQINAHQGSIWCIKFSSDSLYLASAGEDRVVHVWQVIESSSLMPQDSGSSLPPLPRANGGIPPSKGTSKAKASMGGRKSSVPDYVVMPETVFSFSEKPVCSFEGHLDDVLDLSWSKSQYLLSSSMDKTVRLWDMESKTCLKLFAHNDFVTCIQFNPVDDRYFISGSLDAKVRIWSIPDRQVVDWTDLHEMVTAVCYTPDGQGALVGSHKGTCRFYNTLDCKLNQESQLDVWSKRRKSHAKKITGFQFVPGNPSEVLITSADSRIRVFTGGNMIHKFRGFRNTSSQISASFTLDGKYVVCASEDSHVYLWKRNTPRSVGVGGKSKGFVTTSSHEHFYCKNVSVAIPWPNAGSNCTPPPYLPSSSGRSNRQRSDYPYSQEFIDDDTFPSSRSHCPSLPKVSSPERDISPSSHDALRYRYRSGSAIDNSNSSASSSQRSDATISSASVSASSSSSNSSRGWYRGGSSRINSNSAPEASNAWGMVVVTAGLGGDIKIYQNFGLPLRLSRQNNLLF